MGNQCCTTGDTVNSNITLPDSNVLDRVYNHPKQEDWIKGIYKHAAPAVQLLFLERPAYEAIMDNTPNVEHRDEEKQEEGGYFEGQVSKDSGEKQGHGVLVH